MKAEYAMALIKAHAKGDREQFRAVALQVAAAEPALWSGQFAKEVRRLVGPEGAPVKSLTPLPTGRDGDGELVEVRPVKLTLADLVLAPEVSAGLDAIVTEYRHADELREGGSRPSVRVLFDGPPGTGKTSAAGALANALGIPFVVARHERILSSYLAQSSKDLSRVFDFAAGNRCVLLIDEFDSFGRARTADGQAAAGEMNRLLNVLLQLMDRHEGPAIVVAATNLPGAMDHALPRRFDAAVHFPEPTDEQRRELIRRTLGDDDGPYRGSHAEVVRECMREKKRRILERVTGRAA